MCTLKIPGGNGCFLIVQSFNFISQIREGAARYSTGGSGQTERSRQKEFKVEIIAKLHFKRNLQFWWSCYEQERQGQGEVEGGCSSPTQVLIV